MRIVFEVNTGGWFVLGCKKLPRPQMAVVHAVKDDAHSFPGGNKGGNTDHEADEREYTPSTASTAESDK